MRRELIKGWRRRVLREVLAKEQIVITRGAAVLKGGVDHSADLIDRSRMIHVERMDGKPDRRLPTK